MPLYGDNPFGKVVVTDSGAQINQLAIVTKDPSMAGIALCLNAILDELKEIKFHLNEITEFDG